MIHHYFFETIDSTHVWCKENIKLLINELEKYSFISIAAQEQTEGKGRAGNTWLCPKGNLAWTLAFKEEGKEDSLIKNQVLPLLLALSFVETFEREGIELTIKWPNDLLLRGKKIGGCMSLPISSGEKNSIRLLSIGFNVQLDERVKEKITYPVSSLSDIGADSKITPNWIVSNVFPLFHKHYKRFLNNLPYDWESLFSKYGYTRGTRLQWTMNQEVKQGVLEEITSYAHLRLRDYEGKLWTIASGEVKNISLSSP